MAPREEALASLESGEAKLEPGYMELGDVMIRDVRSLHRGTPNNTDIPRPMVVIDGTADVGCSARKFQFAFPNRKRPS